MIQNALRLPFWGQRPPSWCPEPKLTRKNRVAAGFWDPFGKPTWNKIDEKRMTIFDRFFSKRLLWIRVLFWKRFASIFMSLLGYFLEYGDFLIFEGSPMRFAYFCKVQTLKNRSNIYEKTKSDSGHAFCSLLDGFGLDFDLHFGAV